MPNLETVLDAQRLIAERFPLLKADSAIVENYARIGVFLENRNAVLFELNVLENLLRQEFHARAHVEFVPKQPIPPLVLKRLLTTVLDRWDQRFHFNSLTCFRATEMDLGEQKITVTRGGQPVAVGTDSFRSTLQDKRFTSLANKIPTGSTPILTGFVDPKLFRLGLLQLGYHWRDPGAGEVHGDMTHRLQWFAITSAFDAGRLKLSMRPLYLFQTLGGPRYWNEQYRDNPPGGAAGPRALWDFLCDCFVPDHQSDPANVGPYCGIESYRSPVSLQWELAHKAIGFVVSKKKEDAKTYQIVEGAQNLELLRMVIANRTVKMSARMQKLTGTAGGGPLTADKQQQFISLELPGSEGVIALKVV